MEAVFCGLLFGVGGKVARGQELVDEILVFAYAVAEHSTMVTVVIKAPLHFNDISCCVGYYRRVSPMVVGLIIIDAHTSVVTTGTAPSYWCGSKVGPGGNGLEDSAFGT